MKLKLTNALLLSGAVAFGAVQTAVAGGDECHDDKSLKHHSTSTMHKSDSGVRLSKLMDAKIKSSDGESLGEIEDVIVEPGTGEIKFAIVGKGGFLGLGEKLVPVPWQAINAKSDKEFSINLDSEKLKTAPTAKDKTFAQLNDPSHTATIYQFYSVPAGGSADSADMQSGRSSSSSSSLESETDSDVGSSSNVEDTTELDSSSSNPDHKE